MGSSSWQRFTGKASSEVTSRIPRSVCTHNATPKKLLDLLSRALIQKAEEQCTAQGGLRQCDLAAGRFRSQVKDGRFPGRSMAAA